MQSKPIIPTLLLALALTGCSRTTFEPVCLGDFAVEVTPTERTIQVGQSFTAAATAVTCGGRRREPYTAAWRTTRRDVVEVEQNGRITGLRPGVAEVTVHDPTVSADWAWTRLTVTVVPN